MVCGWGQSPNTPPAKLGCSNKTAALCCSTVSFCLPWWRFHTGLQMSHSLGASVLFVLWHRGLRVLVLPFLPVPCDGKVAALFEMAQGHLDKGLLCPHIVHLCAQVKTRGLKLYRVLQPWLKSAKAHPCVFWEALLLTLTYVHAHE